MSKSAKQIFNYVIKTVDDNVFRCSTEDAKSAVVKCASYSNDILVGVDVFEKAIKGLNLDESVMLHNSLCVHDNKRICSVHIEHTVLYSNGELEDDE